MGYIPSLALTTLMVLASAGDAEGLQEATQSGGQQTVQPSESRTPSAEYLTSGSGSPWPYSEAVRVGNILYLSGKIGTDTDGKLVSGGISAESRQAMENIRSALERFGSSLDQVVKCTVMLADIQDFAAMNAVYSAFFRKDRLPARSTFGVSGLPLGARIEIDCIAILK